MAAGARRAAPEGRASDLVRLMPRVSTILGLIGMVIIFAVRSPVFLSKANILDLLTQTAVLAIAAAGLTAVVASGEMDISMGSVLTLAGVIAVGSMGKGAGLIQAVGAALAVGLTAGVVNGTVSIYLRVSSFIATLAIAAIADGSSLLYSGGYRLYKGMLPGYRFLGTGRVVGIPVPVIVMFVFIGLLYLLLNQTVWGRRLYAVGGNVEAAWLSGVNPKLLKMLAFLICGLGAGLAGIVVTARSGVAEPFARFAYTIDCYAAIFLGTTVTPEGEPTMFGTAIGILILGVLNNGLNLFGVAFYLQNVLKGLLILAAVVGGSLLRMRRGT